MCLRPCSMRMHVCKWMVYLFLLPTKSYIFYLIYHFAYVFYQQLHIFRRATAQIFPHTVCYALSFFCAALFIVVQTYVFAMKRLWWMATTMCLCECLSVLQCTLCTIVGSDSTSDNMQCWLDFPYDSVFLPKFLQFISICWCQKLDTTLYTIAIYGAVRVYPCEFRLS